MQKVVTINYEKDLIDAISLVSKSSYREKILYELEENMKTPSKIARATGIQSSHISKYLKSLKEANLIICLNENANQGRIYIITDLGKQVLNHI